MNSRQNIAWGLTKAAGMLLLWNTLNCFFTILQNTMMATSVPQGPMLLSQGSGLMSGWVAEGFACGVLGIYLLASGRLLMRLMGQDGDPE